MKQQDFVRMKKLLVRLKLTNVGLMIGSWVYMCIMFIFTTLTVEHLTIIIAIALGTTFMGVINIFFADLIVKNFEGEFDGKKTNKKEK